jgi:hypothetical protein
MGETFATIHHLLGVKSQDLLQEWATMEIPPTHFLSRNAKEIGKIRLVISKQKSATDLNVLFLPCCLFSDSDRDCQSGLICLQRNAQSSNTVPGCSGTARDGTDFCVDPQDVRGFTGTPPAPTPSSAGQLALVGDNGRPSRAFPLKRCQGDW